MIYVRDVAHVRDGNPPQTNIVRVDGKRAIMMSIMKTGSASTLDIIKDVRDHLDSPSSRGNCRRSCRSMRFPTSRSLCAAPSMAWFARRIIAACLTAVMILIFLGSWRSTLIIAVSIPLRFSARITVLAAAARDHQHHDAWRPGAGCRHSGRRCDGRDRKHQPQSRTGQGDRAGHPGWRGADRHSCAGFHARHLHRVCADVPAERRGTLPVCASWPRPWCSPCSPAICSRERLCRRWRSICCTSTTMLRWRGKQVSRNPLVRFQSGFERGLHAVSATATCGC